MDDGGGETFLAAAGQFEPLNLGYLVGAMTLSITTLSITTPSITTLSITTLSIMTLTIMGLFLIISINFQDSRILDSKFEWAIINSDTK
jgi:hypothetical protein